MTFEQLIRQDLMQAVKTAYPALAVDSKDEPKVCRVLITERDFDRSNPRRDHLGAGGDPKSLTLVEIRADATYRATLEFHAEDRPDIEKLLAALLADEDVNWTWMGYPVRVERLLQNTRLAKGDNALVDRINVDYIAPYFEVKNIPVITDESWFDGWNYDIADPGDEDDDE